MSDIEGRPLISTQDNAQEPKKKNSSSGGSGCFGTIVGLIFWILVLVAVVKSCGKDDVVDSKKVDSQTPAQTEVATTKPDSTNGEGEDKTENIDDTLTLSDKASGVEKRYFHKFYTDMGTVEIHHFEERKKLLEDSVALLEQAAQGNIQFLDYQVKLLSADYYYITANEDSKYYYVGETKDNRPDGFGMIFGRSTGSGTYDLSDEFVIYYIGSFKEGVYNGFGALFSVDEYDLSSVVYDLAQTGAITSEEVGSDLVQYLFNHVSYEGHFKDGQKNGKGNGFDIFPITLTYTNEPIDEYRYYNAYPDVTKGEYKNDELTGNAIIYEHNHLKFSGKLDKGIENGKGTWYYNNGQIQYEGEFKNGTAHGKGAYYSENGELIYSGQWKNGDYAH